MKRTLLLLALALLLGATPALAAKGGQPPQTTGTFDVTLSGALASTCNGETITMTGNLPGQLRADTAMVELNLPLGWTRAYDAGWGYTGSQFSGCHGQSQSATDTDMFGGALILDVAVDGAITVTWRFDYYWQFGVNPRNGKATQEVLELFELNSAPIVDGTGTFEVTLFTKEGKTIVNSFTPIGTYDGTLDITILPVG
ncbi:MAG: hypothetical protein OEX97_00325 [Acidimicrobiia bacterium]|nr:hypothetical protein [Acidimicrobiia bacterium]